MMGEEHAIQDILFQKGYTGREYKPKRLKKSTPPDSCRLHGTISTNKVWELRKADIQCVSNLKRRKKNSLSTTVSLIQISQ